MKDARLIAERYAQALSEAVPSNDELTRVKDDLGTLAKQVLDSPELRRALRNPTVSPESKRAVLAALATAGNARPTTLRFLDVVAAHDRAPLLAEITAAVVRSLDARLGIIEAEVESAVALDEGMRARLEPVIARMTGKQVRLTESVDPEILGGLVVTIGGTVYDGSVRMQLETLRSKLAGEMAVSG